MFLKDYNKTAIIWKDQKISYRKLISNVNSFARLYSKLDSTKVVIFAENRPDWAYAFYSTWKNDTIAIPIDFMSTSGEVAYILNDCKPEIIIYSESTKKVMEDALKETSHKYTTFILDEIEEVAEEAEPEPFPEKDINKTSVIIYTSGTTGSPKGVMLSFDNILANAEAVSEGVPIFNIEERVLVLLPLHHTFPLLGTLVAPFYVGATIAISPSMNSEDIMETLQNNKITIMIGVPRFYNLLRNGIKDKIKKSKLASFLFKLAEKVNSRSFSKKIFKTVHQKFGGHIKYLVCGGAAIDNAVEKDYGTLGFEMLPGFGMTEAAPMITFPRPGKVRLGSGGQPLPSNEVRILDGEVITRGRNVMQGYYNRQKETDEVIIDGWLHTGDLGYLDKDNYLFITGRKKEIIILPSGKNVNPVEVEFKIMNMTDCINEMGVFLHDNTLQAVIVPEKAKVDEYKIQDFEKTIWEDVISVYNKSVSAYKRLQKIHIIDQPLPKTRLEKLKRFKLYDLISTQINEDKKQETEPEYAEYKVIRDFIRSQVEKDIFPNDHIDIDLGLDSLDKVSLQAFLKNTFGVEIKEFHLEEHPTIKKLSEFIKEKSVKMKVEVVNWSEILQEKVRIKLPESWFTINLFKNSARFFFKLIFKISIKGTEKIPESPFILVANHQSFFDGLFVAIGLNNNQMKKTYFYAKEKHVRKAWVRFIANRNNVIVVDITSDVKLSLQKLAAVLNNGNNVIIFPEGTRSDDGSLGQFKKTYTILSHELKIPIVPISISGAYDALPSGKRLPKFGTKIDILFNDPISPEGYTPESLNEKVFEVIKKNITKG